MSPSKTCVFNSTVKNYVNIHLRSINRNNLCIRPSLHCETFTLNKYQVTLLQWPTHIYPFVFKRIQWIQEAHMYDTDDLSYCWQGQKTGHCTLKVKHPRSLRLLKHILQDNHKVLYCSSKYLDVSLVDVEGKNGYL